ncbi:DTNA [Cordylochernes scorpioides]|uniref:Dystrobrevin n=1 Tax=Cordylochernes scorpioides TaxID=51811 RepID=A0ABY6K0U5_9ARAC|nr:DTNA [Cordylochernes scorpioides]
MVSSTNREGVPEGQNFDVIRFASYRTACKLRFIQKKTNFHIVDIWNVIESFRENGLKAAEPRGAEVFPARLEQLVGSIYVQLNKRLPPGQQIDPVRATSTMLAWLRAAYDPEDSGRMRVLSIKVGLALMCAGKLTDKLRYIFSLLSDSNGLLVYNRCCDFLREALALPCSVLESPTFSYREELAVSLFDQWNKVTVNDFLDTLLADPSPPYLAWLPLLHRMASVENGNFPPLMLNNVARGSVEGWSKPQMDVCVPVAHPIQCDGCNREGFLGFRYKCQRCYNYQLCQDCFWRGRVSGSHTLHHPVKEYTEYKSASKQLGHSLRKSFRCVPEKPSNPLPRYPEEPEQTLDLSHIIPPSPIPTHNGFLDHAFDMASMDSHSSKSPFNSLDSSFRDDEHKLIARYAAKLASSQNSAARSPSEISTAAPAEAARKKEIISQLERRNREIMLEIARLRSQQQEAAEQSPSLLVELRALRQHKEQLESHLASLQDSRRDLMLQLEALMKMLKVQAPAPSPSLALMSGALQNHQMSPRSTPNSSPHSSTRSAPPTPGASLRNDLLVAADSVTNAMSSLVRELNSDSEDEAKTTDNNKTALSSSRDFETEEDGESTADSLGGTKLHFLEEIEARKQASPPPKEEEADSNPREMFQRHASFTTDDESYVRTDDDEDNTDWEETVNRWVNR